MAITDAAHGDLVAAGLMTLSPAGLARLVAGMRITGVPRRRDQATWLARFHARFLGSLLSVYTRPLGRVGDLPAAGDPFPGTGRALRSLRLPAPEPRWCDGTGRWREGGDPGRDAWLRLTRYRGGGRGPVLLAAGFGMSATSFLLDTIETNLAEYLVEHGYDVWLFDYRAGIDLPSARSSCTIDDIALRDWPTAVDEVRRVTGRRNRPGGRSLRRLDDPPDGAGGGPDRRTVTGLHPGHPAHRHLDVQPAKVALPIDHLLGLAGLPQRSPRCERRPPARGFDLLLQSQPMPRASDATSPSAAG